MSVALVPAYEYFTVIYRNEREAYYFRRAQAEQRPKQILSIIIDGMDQKKTDLPHYRDWNNPNVCLIFKASNALFFLSTSKQDEHMSTFFCLCLYVCLSHKDESRVLKFDCGSRTVT